MDERKHGSDDSWIQTYRGLFWPMDPDPADVDIIDIAISLARQCRFKGHCKEFYSVAQHSVLVSQMVPKEDALWGLLHDASEAYIGDLPSPIKRNMPEFCSVDKKIQDAVCDAFGLPYAMPDSVNEVDLIMLATEKRDLMDESPRPWQPLPDPTEFKLDPVDPNTAYLMFIARAKELGLNTD